MDTLLEPLLQSPKLPRYVEDLKQILAAEQAARRKFRETLSGFDKAEFINGQVILHFPPRFRQTQARKLLGKLLDTFVVVHDLGLVGDERVVTGLFRNDLAPDLAFYGRDKAAGIKPDQVIFPAPDFVVEILSETTEARDRGIKMQDYAANGVREYWLVDAEQEFVEQYGLKGGDYVLRSKQVDGMLRSTVVTGFIIPARAVFDQRLNAQILSQIPPAAKPPLLPNN